MPDLEKYLFSQREFLQNSSFKNAKKSSQQLNNTYSHLTYDVYLCASLLKIKVGTSFHNQLRLIADCPHMSMCGLVQW